MKRKAMKKSILENGIFALSAVVFLLLVWQIAYAVMQNPYLLPSPWACVQKAVALLGEGGFWSAFFSTLLRCLFAFILSFIFAAVFALISYLLSAFSKFFSPIASSIRSLPTMAIILILLVLTTPLKAPVIVAFLTLFPMLYTSIYAALKGTDKELIEMSKLYKVPLKKQIISLYLPAVAPEVCLHGGAALSFSLKVVVSAEILSHTYQSLGGMMQDANLFVEMPTLFALVLVVFVTGLAIELSTLALSERLRRRLQ